MAQRSAPAPQGGALCRAVAPVLRAAASLRGMLAPPVRQRAAPPLAPAGRRVDVGASSVLRGVPAAHSAAAAARARHWRARALPGFAGAYPAARRAGRGSPPAIPRLYKPPQGLRARSGPRPPQARFARPCRALPPWCGAAAAGCPQPRPAPVGAHLVARRPRRLRPRSLPFWGGCAPGCAGLAMRLSPPQKGRSRQPLPRVHPTPRPPLKGRERRVAPGLLFSFGRDIICARGTSPKLAFKLDHPQHVAAVSLSLTKYSVLYNDRVSLRAPRSLYTISTKQIILYNLGDARAPRARAARQPP